jgi:hypothetical protein
MAHEHGNFDCEICGEHFRSKDELDKHNRDSHSQTAGGLGTIGSEGGSGDSRNASTYRRDEEMDES